MLIRFSVENFISFKDKVEFSMIAGKAREYPNHAISTKRGIPKILKAGVVYGANAAGKSNLIKAMSFARQIILNGVRPGRLTNITPFRFDAKLIQQPSLFEFEFFYKNKGYIYGFMLDAKRIHDEWLYEIGSTTEKMIFERSTDEQGKTTVEFGIPLADKKQRDFFDFVAMRTRPEQLFLTESREANIDEFRDVVEWFGDVLVIIYPDSHRQGLEFEFMKNSDFKTSFQDVLSLFDTGINEIKLQDAEWENLQLPNEVKDDIRQELLQHHADERGVGVVSASDGQGYLLLAEDGEIIAKKLMTGHKVSGEERLEFLEVYEESDGTQRLFDLIPALLDLSQSERVFVIDELDRSLHPHLSQGILQFFLNNSSAKSQLIVTTHESSLLDLSLLRRDEIWFVEKSNEGVSNVYSLEEFTPRKDKDIRKGYLLGRYGAIPFIQDVSWSPHAEEA